MSDTKASTPESVTRQILKYLERQEFFYNEEECALHKGRSGIVTVRSILEEILAKIENRADLIEEFQRKLHANNQYPLFDLGTFIPDFHIDDELYKKLSFRETLVVSTFRDNPSSPLPRAVGGLCLDIQTARGKNPSVRKDPGLEQKIIELLTSKANEARKVCEEPTRIPRPSLASSAVSEADVEQQQPVLSEEDLDNFEASLRPKYQTTFTKFLVHVSSQFDADGGSGGSRISAWVDRNFHTLEEKRREYVMVDGAHNEKSLYCALQPRRYYVSHKSTVDSLVDRKYYSMRKTRDLICEGANFVLMRYLAITRYIGTFEMSTMYINGDMCRNIYRCTGPESGMVNEQKLDLCRIYRTIVEECGITHCCSTVLTLNGQIVKQEWADCPYVLHLNPLAKVSNKTPSGNEHLFLEKTWEKDMQLFSTFLDIKNTCRMQAKSYLLDHPEFKSMMADYVQTTLLMKPEDVLGFTVEHFTRYCTRRPQHQDDVNEEYEDDRFYF